MDAPELVKEVLSNAKKALKSVKAAIDKLAKDGKAIYTSSRTSWQRNVLCYILMMPPLGMS